MSNILRRIGEWHRSYKREVALGWLIFFVAALSFSLGYMSKASNAKAPIIIEKCSETGESGNFF